MIYGLRRRYMRRQFSMTLRGNFLSVLHSSKYEDIDRNIFYAIIQALSFWSLPLNTYGEICKKLFMFTLQMAPFLRFILFSCSL